MKTSKDVLAKLADAKSTTDDAHTTLRELVAVHDYQDVTGLVIQAAEQLLVAAEQFMQKDSQTALDKIEAAEDLLDELYDIIEGDLKLGE